MRILSLVLVVLVSQTPQKPAAAPPELRFAWPEHITATVESERVKEQRQGTTPKRSAVKVRYRMQVLPHPKGRLIRYTDYEILEPAVARQDAEQVAQMLTSMVPSIIVNTDGTFAAIEDLEALRKAINVIVEPMKKDAAGNAGLEEMVQALTSERFLSGAAAQEWDGLVGTWIEMALSPEPMAFEVEAPFPLFPNMAITLKGTVRMAGKSDCQRGGTTVPCATFEMVSSPDPATVEAVFQRIVKDAKGMGGVKYEQFDLRTTLRVTLETETMLPHDYAMTKTIKMAATVPGEGRQEAEQIEKRTSKFTYAPTP